MNETEMRAVVEAAYARWNSAFNRGDAAGIAALYAPHACFLPATHEVHIGPDEIRRFFAGVLASGLTGHANEILAVGGDGRLIHSATRWTVVMVTTAGRTRATRSAKPGRPAWLMAGALMAGGVADWAKALSPCQKASPPSVDPAISSAAKPARRRRLEALVICDLL